MQKTEKVVLPYFGGSHVQDRHRRYRLAGELEPGWWQLEVTGRTATPKASAEPPDLAQLPAVRGHVSGPWLFRSGAVPERIALFGEEEPAALSPVTARRWYSDDLVLDSIDFEEEVESAARRALEEQRPIGDIRGVGASLRAAFSFALASAVSRDLAIPISPLEIRGNAVAIADGGRPVVERLLATAAERRRQHQARVAARFAHPEWRHRRQPPHTAEAPEERAREALRVAGARLTSTRQLSGGHLEVVFAFQYERFISVVDVNTLQVYDAGICLDGADENLTLDSLPGAIREAIDTGQLHITNR